jgi:tetratricopeptide (TPR) repeat protein
LKKFIVSFIILLFIFSCITKVQQPAQEKANDFEKLILNAQEMTNRGRYIEAVNILNDGFTRFPDVDVLTLNYNIGFNYYKLSNYDEAKKYFNRVINLFENNQSNSNQDQNEERKFVVLSGVMLDRIQKDIEAKKDPYHIKEEIQDSKKVTPKVKSINKK